MIEEATKHFKKGDVVVFPTDTIYGIGCDVRNEDSIRKIHKIRKDSPEKPVLILASDLNQASEYGFFGIEEKNFVKKFWPGSLTVVVKAKEKTPKIVQGKNQTVGIRIPNQPPILEIIRKLDAPIIAPSANFHGNKAPTNFQEIDKGILALVDYAIDLEKLPGKTRMEKKASTLVDLTNKPLKILRFGTIPKSAIMNLSEGASR